MGREAFGHLVGERRKELHLSRGFIATRLVLASGGDYFDSTSVRNIEEGKREITEELFAWLVEMLKMDRDEADEALGRWPEGITAEEVRELRGKQTGGNRRRSDRPLKVVASSPAAEASTDQQGSNMGTWTVPAGELVAA